MSSKTLKIIHQLLVQLKWLTNNNSKNLTSVEVFANDEIMSVQQDAVNNKTSAMKFCVVVTEIFIIKNKLHNWTLVTLCRIRKFWCKCSASLDVHTANWTAAILCEPLVNTCYVKEMHTRQTSTKNSHKTDYCIHCTCRTRVKYTCTVHEQNHIKH